MGIPWDGMGWDRHNLLWDGMGWDRKICPMDKPAFNKTSAKASCFIICSAKKRLQFD